MRMRKKSDMEMTGDKAVQNIIYTFCTVMFHFKWKTQVSFTLNTVLFHLFEESEAD